MKLKIKFMVAIIFSSIFSIIFFTTNDVQALTQEEAGQYIAEFSINFCDNYADQTIYSWTDAHRFRAYNDVKTTGNLGSGGKLNGTYFENKYAMDCVGWVSFAIHHALGINSNTISSKDGYSFSFFVVPTNSTGTDTSIMEKVTGDLMPGDILVNEHHVMVYVGNDTIVDSAGVGTPTGAISKRTLSEYGQGYNLAYRIRSDVAAKINESDATTIFNGKAGITWSDSASSSSSSSVATQDGRIVDVDDKLPLFKHILLTEKYNFNNIKWKSYGHGYDGKDSEMKEDLNLGLKYPKDEKKTLDNFIDFVLPYLQNWMIPLGMNAGVNAKGADEEVANNPLFTYSVIRKAMSDIIVNRYDITTCVLTTKYKYYDIIKVTETRASISTDKNSLTALDRFTGFIDESSLQASEEVVKKGVKEPEEVVSKELSVESEYYIKQAWTFDSKITNTFKYTKYSDSDVDNLVENGVGFCGRGPEKDGETINEIYDKTTSMQGNQLITTYYKKVGSYKYLTRTWRDEIKPEEAKSDSYTYEDVLNYNKGTNTSTTSEGASYSFDGTIYDCEKYDLSEEKIKTLAKKVASEDDASLEGQAAMISQMINRYEYVGKSEYSDVVDYVYNGGWYASDNANQPTEETYALIRSIICEGKRTLPPYVTEMDGIAEMKHWFPSMVRYLSIEGYPNPERGKSKVLGSYGAEGIYWCHFDYGGEGNVFYYVEDYKNKCIENNIEVSEEKIENLVSNVTSSNSNNISSNTQIESLEGFLFIGDSLTAGLKDNNCLSEATVMGVVSSSAVTWNKYLDGQNPVLDYSHISLPDSSKGISVTLGINSLNIENGGSTSGVVDNTLSQTKTLLSKLETKYLNTPIYVQRVFPIASKAKGYDVAKTNQVVNEYNEKMKAYCSEKGYTYIDATSGLIDSEGNLDSSMTSDGVHFTSNGYSTWENNIRNAIANGGTVTSSSNVNNTEFSDIDDSYYQALEIDNEINKVDLMNSKPSEYLEYLSEGTQYSNHIGYSRAYLTFSYSALKRLFSDYFSETNEVPFAYGSSLGYKVFTGSNSLKNTSSVSNVIEGNIETVPGAVQVPDGLGKDHSWTIWNHVNENYNPRSTWPAGSSQAKLILHLTNNNEESLHGELAGDITANSKRMVCYGEWLASAMVSQLGGTQGNPEKKLNVGDLVFIIQDNGTFYPIVLTDTKVQFNATYYDPNPANEWGHDNGKCMVEFQGHTSSWRNVPSTPSEFNHYIKQVYVVGNIYTNPEYLNNIEKAAKDVGLDTANMINPKTL